MLEVWLPATDRRWLVMPRFTQPEPDQAILLHKLHLELPPQPPPRIIARLPKDRLVGKLESPNFLKRLSGCRADLFHRFVENQ
jgi:hypothetical protein